jgi:transcriptional regulator with XRE-family HTH domain
MPTDASAQRLRIGAELRRLRELAGLSGEQVARALSWSQPKVSRIEMGRTAFTVKDVANLLALYGVTDDVRAELLGSTAEDIGEGAWIVRAGGFPRRQGAIASLESVTKRIRHHQPVVLPGLLQTREYARAVAQAAGVEDPDAITDARMRRQEVIAGKGGPQYDVVVDARALLLGVGSPDLIRDQASALADRAERQRRLDFRIIPFGRLTPVFSPVGFTVYDFRAEESPSVAWIESPTGDVYFSAADDIERYSALFKQLQGVALSARDSVGYLRSFAADVERYTGEPISEGGQT